jgi:hypothetical protein
MLNTTALECYRCATMFQSVYLQLLANAEGTDPKGLGAIRKVSDRVAYPKDVCFPYTIPYIKVAELILIQFQLFFIQS